MVKKKKYVAERRKYKRVAADSVVAFNDSFLAEIVDIGKGGLAFNTIAGSRAEGGVLALSILSGDGELFLDNVRCRNVFDIETGKEGLIDYIKLRRRGVQFEELTPEQAARLERYVKKQE